MAIARDVLLRYRPVADDPKSVLPEVPRLPERAAIYIAPDGSVSFGALFAGLLPVAEAISGKPIALDQRPRDPPADPER